MSARHPVDSHIPFAMPRQPWIMRQSWHELLFLHWPVPVAMLQPLLPSGLAPDTFWARRGWGWYRF